METDETVLKRWGRVVDVVESGVLYMEDAERLILHQVKLPDSPDKRAQAEALLMDLANDDFDASGDYMESAVPNDDDDGDDYF